MFPRKRPGSFLTNSKFYFVKTNNADSFTDDMNDILKTKFVEFNDFDDRFVSVFHIHASRNTTIFRNDNNSQMKKSP